MIKYFNDHKLILFIAIPGLTLISIGILNLFSGNREEKEEASVKSVSLNLEAVVRPEVIEFIVYPEKRIPTTNNWDTIAEFKVQDCLTQQEIHTYSGVNSDNFGVGVVNIPISDILLDKNYSFSVKGYSHLNKQFGCYGVNYAYTTVDLTGEGPLLAGDTSVISDNYINSLDISNLIRFLYSTDYKNDLNQDGEVNSLDFSNLLFNYYKSGD